MSVVKSFSVGNGDMFYIKHNSDSFSIIDCCMNDDDRERIVIELKEIEKGKGITRFISTHPDEDHLLGLKYLDSEMNIPNFYCVENNATKKEPSEDFKYYCSMRDGKHHYYIYSNCKRKWLNEDDETRGSAGINFLWPDTSNADYKIAKDAAMKGEAYNNLSPIFTYTTRPGTKIMWMGDIEGDFLERIKNQVTWAKIDILFAPHHGRSSGKVSAEILKILDPYLIVIGEAPSEHINYYSDFNTVKQNTAKDIVFDCDGNYVHIYVGNPNYNLDVSFLKYMNKKSNVYGYYLGSFEVNGGKP